MERTEVALRLKGIAISLVVVVLLAAILFAAAGRLNWPMAWAALGVLAAIFIVGVLLADSGLIAERIELGPGIRRTDVVTAALSFVFTFPLTLLVAGLDAGRFGWSPEIGCALRAPALAVFALGLGLGCWASTSNKFFSVFIRLQMDRGHAVVSAGPYGYVRHPAYAGFMAASLALPIALGSLWAVLPAFVGCCGWVIRTALEDDVLTQELPGYVAYRARIRYRLFPGVW
jgi:protein-S-isoprenylcysteine O-methyltransferase Ste14